VKSETKGVKYQNSSIIGKRKVCKRICYQIFKKLMSASHL